MPTNSMKSSRSLSRHFTGRFLIRRFTQSIFAILIIIIINFTLIHIAPGDPAQILAGQNGDQHSQEFIRAKFGLDSPLTTQLWIYLKSILRGDLGYSLGYQQPVMNVIFERVPATLLLMLTAISLSAIAGVILGVEAARRRHSFADQALNAFTLAGNSIPSFSVGHLLLITFALYLGLFPSQNMYSAVQRSGLNYLTDVLSHLVLPAVTLTIVYIPHVMRLTRSSMVTVLGADFIITARAKGLSERRVVYGHALRNALLPVVTIIGSDMGMLLSGAVFVEIVFAWPGLGRLMLDAVAMRDYPVVMGLFLLISITVVATNFLTDMAYAAIDPRIKYA